MSFIVGIDEVGRGALAGPVVVAALALPAGFRVGRSVLGPLKDSKRLTKEKREAWHALLRDKADVFWAVSRVSPVIIDRVGVSFAGNLAATRALQRLLFSNPPLRAPTVYLDGSLYLTGRSGSGAPPFSAKTVIRGDEKINAIKAASIVAKVSRDCLMERVSEKYPEYGFARHKGYGTYAHKKAIKRYGPCPLHRKSFRMS